MEERKDSPGLGPVCVWGGGVGVGGRVRKDNAGDMKVHHIHV